LCTFFVFVVSFVSFFFFGLFGWSWQYPGAIAGSTLKWFNGVAVVSVDVMEGAFQEHCIPGRFAGGLLVSYIVNG
jgi:hypothetical protein